jgi:hypothetical protein
MTDPYESMTNKLRRAAIKLAEGGMEPQGSRTDQDDGSDGRADCKSGIPVAEISAAQFQTRAVENVD